jgi:hypothetical protein
MPNTYTTWPGGVDPTARMFKDGGAKKKTKKAKKTKKHSKKTRAVKTHKNKWFSFF